MTADIIRLSLALLRLKARRWLRQRRQRRRVVLPMAKRRLLGPRGTQ